MYGICPVLPEILIKKDENGYIKSSNFIKKYRNMPYPLVIDRDNRVLSGNHLYWVARDEGITVIPVIKLKNVKIL